MTTVILSIPDENKTLDGESAEVQVEYRLDSIIRELDEFCGMANNPETVDLIERNRVAIGQIATRLDLISSFFMAHQPPLRKVCGHG